MYPNSHNPMLKGYISHQERDQIRERERERERRSRCQIAEEASRDFFMEQTGGATFSQPVRVKPDDRTNQISNILGSFEQVAPIMRSERARNSLVGAFAMPCTPAPVHQDHDHLFGPPPPSPLPPPPPPPPAPVRQERRPEPRVAPGVGGHERRPFQAPAPPPPPQPMATSAMLAAMTMSQQRHGARPGTQRIEKRSLPGDVETILQEMRAPGMIPITPLKAQSQPFLFPPVKDIMPPVTPLHRPEERVPPMEVDLTDETPWQPPAPTAPPPQPPPPQPAAPKPSLSDDLDLSDDSDDDPPPKEPPARDTTPSQRPDVRSRTSPAPPPPEPAAPAPAAAPAASSGSSSESEESGESEESAESESESGDEPAPPVVVASPAVSQRSTAEAKEGSESPGNAGSKWSLMSIMNGKDAVGTPMSSVFGNASARSLNKMSPHDFPNSAEGVNPSSAEPADNADADISLEDIVSQVKVKTPSLVSEAVEEGEVPMEMSQSSSSSEDEAPREELRRGRTVSGGSVRSTTGGKRPRPRLSALSESDSEKLTRVRPRTTPRPAAAAASVAAAAASAGVGGGGGGGASPSPSSTRRPGRPGRPRVRARPSPPPVAVLSDSDSDAERPAPPPPRPVPTKASLKSPAAAAERSRRSRRSLSTASESSDEVEAVVAAAAPPAPRQTRGCSSDSDSPPKLDAGGVTTSDANKKATVNRLFSHRFRKTTPRSRPTPSSERSEGQSPVATAEPTAPGPPPPPPAAVVAAPAPMGLTLPQLTTHNGVPSLRCRIDRCLVPDARQRAEARAALFRAAGGRSEPRHDPPSGGDRLRDVRNPRHSSHHSGSSAHQSAHQSHQSHHGHNSHGAHVDHHRSRGSHAGSHHGHQSVAAHHTSSATRPEPHGPHSRREDPAHHRGTPGEAAHLRDDSDSAHARLEPRESRSDSSQRRRDESEERSHHRSRGKLDGTSPSPRDDRDRDRGHRSSEDRGGHHHGLKRESPSPRRERERVRHHSGARPDASPRTHKQHRKAGHRSRHHAADDAANKLTPRGDGSVRSHSSCSSRAADDVTRDDDAAPVTSHKRQCRGLTPETRTKAPGSGHHESRIESPPTGVREADSSTNPTTTVTVFDSNVPAALYTNQPFPIPADQHQYLKQARRLKRAADNEADMTLKLIRYTQAVIYFLLTALSMEKEREAEDADAMSAMLHDTLKLIKSSGESPDPAAPVSRDMLRLSSATYRKQGKRPTHIDDKLQTLLLRCQGLIYLRLFKLREAELKRVQRQTADLKAQTLNARLEESSCAVPVELFRTMLWCNEQQTHLQNWLDYWEQADRQMQQAQDTAVFFAEVDRTMGGLPATSSLDNLVYYIRETTRRLQDMHSRAVV